VNILIIGFDLLRVWRCVESRLREALACIGRRH
jgi:hypothetical protein